MHAGHESGDNDEEQQTGEALSKAPHVMVPAKAGIAGMLLIFVALHRS